MEGEFERFKQSIFRHFEIILALAILVAAFLGTYLLKDPTVVLNFYFMPVLVSSYFLGRRMGVLTALLSVLLVVMSAILFPTVFFADKIVLENIGNLASWGGFLILTSVVVGTLYETNERRLGDLKNAYVGIVEILSKYLESTDRYTKGHSVRVAELAMETAIAMDLDRPTVENIRVAGLLHDVGKIEVSGQVLRKAAELTAEERKQMDEHVEKGGRLLSTVGGVLKEVVPIVMAHHKYFASNLEPQNGHENKIPLGARIVAVADSFDAMTTDRPYRKGMTPWQALEEITVNSGKQFDPVVVDAFKRVLTRRLETM
jgi:putative nucleotidyltransferase with HDIG domain